MFVYQMEFQYKSIYVVSCSRMHTSDALHSMRQLLKCGAPASRKSLEEMKQDWKARAEQNQKEAQQAAHEADKKKKEASEAAAEKAAAEKAAAEKKKKLERQIEQEEAERAKRERDRQAQNRRDIEEKIRVDYPTDSSGQRNQYEAQRRY